MPHSARSWKIHGLALGAFGALYLAVLWGIWTSPPRGLDLRGFASGVLLMLLLGYAVVSSVLMIWVGRRTWGPAVMHTLALAGLAVALLMDQQDIDRREAELAGREAAERRLRVDHCLQLRELRVIRGKPLRAVLELFNGCEVAAVIDDVDLSGFPGAGGNKIFATPERTTTTLQPHRSVNFTLEDIMPGDEPVDAAWKWISNVSVARPQSRTLCFATEGAETGSGRCQTLGRVSIAQR